MKTSSILLRLGGVVNLLLGMLHIAFWDLFDWTNELQKLSIANSNIMQMLNLFTIVFFFYTAYVLLVMPARLLTNTVGRMFILMCAVLYFARLVMEFIFPEGSIGFAIILIVAMSFFVLPFVKTSHMSHATQ